MKKFNFKRQVAALLSAGMVFTMLAPALPVQAATSEYIFDKGIWGKYTGGTPTFSLSGEGGSSVKDAYPGAPNDGTRLYMPFMDAAGNHAHATFTTVPFDFPGYKIQGWYSNDHENMAQGFSLATIPTRFDYRNITYYPKFISDGTTYNLKVDYTVPTSPNINPSPVNDDIEVLKGFQAVPKYLPGFKLKTGFPEFNFYEPGGTTPVTPPATAIEGGKIYGVKSENGYVSGLMVNKDIKVKYEYEVDNTVKFPITVIHHKVENDGTTLIANEDFYVPITGFSATETLTDPALAPKSDYIVPQTTGGQARFILSTATPPKFTRTDGTPVAPNHGSGLLGASDTNLAVAADGTVSGGMVNSSIQLHYYYQPNPSYYLNVGVKYINEQDENITDKVIDALNAATPGTVLDNYDSAQGSKFYKAGGMIERRIQPNDLFSVEAPILPKYEAGANGVSGNITFNGHEYQLDGGTFSGGGWTPANPRFNGKMGIAGKSIVITIRYTHLPGATQQLIIDTEGDGTMAKGGNPFNPGTDAIIKEKDGGKIVIEQTDLPDLLPGPGYLAGEWYVGNNKVTSWPLELDSPYRIKAKFPENPMEWQTFKFALGNNVNGLTLIPDPHEVSYNIASLPAGTPLTMNTLDSEGLMPTANIADPVNYSLVWQDAMGNIVGAGDDIGGYAGETLYGYLNYSGVPSINNPAATGELDPAGVPTIDIGNRNPTSATKYIIVNNAGEVVGITTSAAIATAGDKITGSFLHPGESYKVYEAAPGENPAVGDDINALVAGNPANFSTTPADVSIPVLRNASVTEDPNNRGRAHIHIEPVSPNTQYALLDAAGNEVYPFATPTGNAVTYPDLDPDAVYTVVVRQIGSTETPAQRMPGHPVDTTNLGITLSAFKVEVIFPTGSDPTVVIGGVPKTLADLDSVAPGTPVEITANGLDQNGNFFKLWKDDLLQKPHGGRSRGNTYVFVMPSHPVKIQAMYDTPASWSNAVYNNNKGDGKLVGVNYPDIQDPGGYRIVITKDPMPANVKSAIDADTTEPYTGLWLLHVEVQKLDSSNNWQPYTGTVPPLQANIETGALISSKTYKFHAVDTMNNSVSEMTGPFNADWKDSSYSGAFSVDVLNGGHYAFGFIQPQIYTIKIKDANSNTLLKKLMFSSDMMDSVSNRQSEFAMHINPDQVDTEGITWSYAGLSLDRNNFVPYDDHAAVTADETLYIFYNSDRVLRASTDAALGVLLRRAEDGLSGIIAPVHRRKLQAAYDRAKAIRDKLSPRKSSTPELQAALDELQKVIDSIGVGLGGGGSSGGGGGSGGGSGRGGRSGNINTEKSIRVGRDGDWKLVDAANHKWEFNLKNGGKTKGWASLSYTYGDKTEVEWYHFGDDNIMNSGWFFDGASGKWYYLSEDHDGFFGKMVRGWYMDKNDGRWYYLHPHTGEMLLGWQEIGGKWYYFAPSNNAQTWFYNASNSMWEFRGSIERPYGSMYKNEKTPDGYTVDENGVWIN